MRRVGHALGVVVFFGAALVAHADDAKKKSGAGLFDFQKWKTPVAEERDRARTLAPVELDLTPFARPEGAPRALRVRFYADTDYRAGVLQWQTKTSQLVARVNRVTLALFNVQFEIESVREWNRSHSGVPFASLLTELEALDDARDVDLVIGLATPFRGLATSVHQLAFADLSSRHFVMRAMDDEQEGRELARVFGMLSPTEREQLYDDRKAHKELVVFLHEWAHTLGALHVEDEGLIMNPACDPQQAAFTDFEKRLMGIVLDKRLGDRTQPFPETPDLIRLVEAAPPEEGVRKERADFLQNLRARGAGVRRAPGAAAPAGEPGGLHAHGGPSAVTAPLEQAMTRLRANDVAGATPFVLEAARLADTTPPNAPTLVRLAEAGGAVGALTAAEAALARAGKQAPGGRELVTELDAERCRVALPRERAKAGVAPEDEPRYVAAFWLAIHAVESRNLAAAGRRLAELTEAFPQSVGREVVACELELEAKHAAVARTHCEAAITAFDGAVRAHLALGRLESRAHHDAEAEVQFRRAMMFDPAADDAWRELGRMYLKSGSSLQRDQLTRQHEALFSTPLPR
jgi:hypothetical protein